MENTVAIAAIGLAATAVASIGWVVRYVLTKLVDTIEKHTNAALRQANSSDEVLRFMKNLNGKLEGAYTAKVKEISKKTKGGNNDEL